MVAYPPTLPLECVMTVTTIIRERKVAEKKAQFGHCLWNVQGFAQKTLLGEDTAHATGFGAAREASPEQIQDMAVALDTFATENGQYGSTADEDEAGNAGIIVLLQLVPIIIAALKQLGWIKKNQQFGSSPTSEVRKTVPGPAPDKKK